MAVPQVGNVGVQLNLLIRQGADFELLFTAKDAAGVVVDLTGATIKAQMRKAPSDSAAKTFTITVTNAVGGQFKMSMTAVQTAQIKAADDPKSTDNRYFWDMEMVDVAGKVRALAYGEAWMFREVTRV